MTTMKNDQEQAMSDTLRRTASGNAKQSTGRGLAIAASLCVLLAVSAVGVAQKAPAPADAERLTAAKELFVAMGSEAQFATVVDTMTAGMAGIIKQQHPTKGAEIDDVFGKLKAKFKSRSSEIVDMAAPLWAERFSVAELKEVTKFFQSPIGRKVIAEQPGIMQKSMQMGMVWGQRIGQEVEAEARAELKKRGIDL
jgi:uncharacterized protein